jgi:hypothetical protein
VSRVETRKQRLRHENENESKVAPSYCTQDTKIYSSPSKMYDRAQSTATDNSEKKVEKHSFAQIGLLYSAVSYKFFRVKGKRNPLILLHMNGGR